MAAATVGSQAVADFSVRQPGMQANSDWRKVRPPDRLKPDRDRVKVEIGRSDNDDRRARYWRSHHHRHHRVRYYRDGYYRDGIWYWYD